MAVKKKIAKSSKKVSVKKVKVLKKKKSAKNIKPKVKAAAKPKKAKITVKKAAKKSTPKKVLKKIVKKAKIVNSKIKTIAKQVKPAAKKVIQNIKAPEKNMIKESAQNKIPQKVSYDNKKSLKNVVAINDNKIPKEKETDNSSGSDEKMPVFALRGSLLAQQQVKKTTFEIPSFPQAKIIEAENKNSVAKSKNTKQIASPKSTDDKKMNSANKQVKVNVKYDKAGKVVLPEGYKPSEDEKYMNPLQVEYFRGKLASWKKELLSESNVTIEHLMEESWNEPDPSDQATIVEQTGLELRTRDRYRKLISKIDSALRRIEEGEYGFCEVTGDPIGLKRLEARPIATMSIAAQEQHELEEKLSLED